MYLTKRNNMKISILVVLFLSLCCSLEATAGEKEFKAAVQKAQTAIGEERWADAVRYLKEAHYHDPKPAMLYNIALAYQKMDNCVQALIYYRSFTQDPDAPAEFLPNAKKELRKGKRRCNAYTDDLSGRLVFETTPNGASVKLGNQKIGVTPLEVAGWKPGRYNLEITKSGKAPFKAQLLITKGQDDKLLRYKLEDVSVVKKTDPKKVEKKKDTIVDPGKPKAESSGVNVPAIIMIGTGAVALSVGAYIDLVRLPDYDEQRKKSGISVTEYNELTDSRNSEATIALVSYITGGVLVASGITWLIIDMVSGGEESQEPVVKWAPTLQPGYAGMGVFATF